MLLYHATRSHLHLLVLAYLKYPTDAVVWSGFEG